MSDVIDNIQYKGADRDAALAAYREQVRLWNVALPSGVDPLVMDFGIGDFARIGLIECWICNETEAGYCGKYMYVSDGQQCPPHHHRVKHETFCMIRGRLNVVLDGEMMMLGAGDVLPIAPGRVHSFEGDGRALMLELSMPCDIGDNYFEDERTMAWLRRSLGA